MEVSFLEWLLQQSGPAAVAGLSLWFMQKNHQAYMEREKENIASHRSDKERLLVVLEKNTEAKTRLIEAVAHLERALHQREEPNRGKASGTA